MATSNLPTFFQHSAVTVVDELLDFELGGLEDEEEEPQDLQDPAAGDGIDDEMDGQNDDTFANDDIMGIGGEIALPSFFQSTSTGEGNDGLEMDDRIQMSVGSANSSSSAIGRNDLDVTSLLKGLTWGGHETKTVVPSVNASASPTLPPGAKVLTETEIATMMGRGKPTATVIPTSTPSSLPVPMNYSSAARGITANKPTEQQRIEQPSSNNNNNNNGSSNVTVDHVGDNNHRPQPFPFPLEPSSFPRGPPFGPGWNNGPYGPYGPNGPPMGVGPGFYGPGGGMVPPGMMVMGPRGMPIPAMHMQQHMQQQQQQMHQQQMQQQQQMQAMQGGYPPFGPQGVPGNPNAGYGRPAGQPMYADQRPPQPPGNPPGTNMNNQGPGPEHGSSSGGSGASNNASGGGASGMDPRLRTVGGSQLPAPTPAPGSGPGPQV